MSHTNMYLRTSLFAALSLVTIACQDGGDIDDVMCEDGTIERDGECIPAALQVRLTHLNVRYDLSQPVFVNNRVPVTFGLTADSPDPSNPVSRNVAVSFAFVEANPADPENPLSCGSSAIDVEVLGDGSETVVDGFIWPTTMCGAIASSGATMNLRVDFDGGDEADDELRTDIDSPSVVFSEALRDEPLNQLCGASLENTGTNRGCVYDINLEPTPSGPDGTLIDIRYDLTADSSVAVVPYQPTENIGPNGPADPAPTLVVQSRFVVNGRDPYISAVDPELIPESLYEAVPDIEEELKFGFSESALASLTALPGTAVVTYTIRPAGDETELPLTIGPDDESLNTLSEAVIDEVLPGTASDVVHELFLEGATLDAVSPGGMWEDESDFIVRGCFVADFPQDGNKGDGSADDCRDLEVVLVHETPTSSGASSLTFDEEFSRKLGSSRLAIEAGMSTQNRLDLTGASSEIDGGVVLKGKIGKSFELVLARAHGEAALNIDPTKTYYDAYVEAFNKRIYSASDQAAAITRSDDFSVSKSFTLANLGFGFGPVRIGISIGAGGTLGFEAEDTLEALTDNATCQELLKSGDDFDLCGRMTRVTSPYFGLTGSVEGGLNLRLVKAAVAANLQFITTSFPLDTTLAWGLDLDGKLVVRGDVDWDMNLVPLAGKVFIIGKVGFRRFAKRLKVNLFSFSSPTIKRDLMSFSMGEFEVLQ